MAEYDVKKIELTANGKKVTYLPGKLDVEDILEVSPQGDRLYKLDDIRIDIWTEKYKYTYIFDKGFITNFRSGGFLIDFFIDQIGNQLEQICWICHDGAYTPCSSLGDLHPISRYEADNLLRAMLRFAKVSKVKYQLIYRNLRMFAGSAYSKDDELTPTNKKLFEFCKKGL
jgi:hypothetical protein